MLQTQSLTAPGIPGSSPPVLHTYLNNHSRGRKRRVSAEKSPLLDIMGTALRLLTGKNKSQQNNSKMPYKQVM